MIMENSRTISYHANNKIELLIFELEISKIRLVLKEFNNNGIHVPYEKISEITDMDISKSIDIRNALPSVVHYYRSRKEIFEEKIKSLGEQKIKSIKTIMNTLNSKGLEGLELLYEM